MNCGDITLMAQGQKQCQRCYRQNNPQVIKALDTKAQNRRRARKYNTRVTESATAAEYKYVLLHMGPCVYCNGPAEVVDHITPLARGGHEAFYNFAPACNDCNMSKKAHMLMDWIPGRVAHALSVSEHVRSEYARQRAGVYAV